MPGAGAAAATSLDPVCGMTVSNDSPHEVAHDGRRYVFCSAGCRAKFVADPQRYLQNAGAPPHGRAAHPEKVVSDTDAPVGAIYT